MTIIGYTFKAENYTPSAIVAAMAATNDFDGWGTAPGIVMSVEDNLDEIASHFSVNRDDEWSFNSDDFPKVIRDDQLEAGITFRNEHDDYVDAASASEAQDPDDAVAEYRAGVDVVTCGACGHRFPDNTPAGRCPLEGEHEDAGQDSDDVCLDGESHEWTTIIERGYTRTWTAERDGDTLELSGGDFSDDGDAPYVFACESCNAERPLTPAEVSRVVWVL